LVTERLVSHRTGKGDTISAAFGILEICEADALRQSRWTATD